MNIGDPLAARPSPVVRPVHPLRLRDVVHAAPSPPHQTHRDRPVEGTTGRCSWSCFVCTCSDPLPLVVYANDEGSCCLSAKPSVTITQSHPSMRIVCSLVGSRSGVATQHVQRSPPHHLGVSVVDTDILTPSGRRWTAYCANPSASWKSSIRLFTSASCKTLFAAIILDIVTSSRYMRGHVREDGAPGKSLEVQQVSSAAWGQ